MRKSYYKTWSINEASISNWGTEGMLNLFSSSGSYLRLNITVSIVGIVWLYCSLLLERSSYTMDWYRLKKYDKASWNWEFSIKVHKGTGVKQFFINIKQWFKTKRSKKRR